MSGSTSDQSRPPTPVASRGRAMLVNFSFSASLWRARRAWLTFSVLALPAWEAAWEAAFWVKRLTMRRPPVVPHIQREPVSGCS